MKETNKAMTLETANQIWNDCYGDPTASKWDEYTSTERLEAIRVRDEAHNGPQGQWGIWNISDRD